MANRILGMGDILTLIERAQQEVDEERAEEMATKMRENRYDFNDFIEQMDQMQNMGPLEDIIKMIPGMSNLPGMDQFEVDPKDMAHMKAIVMSMTKEERENPDLLSQKRRRRIAKGLARDIAEVNRLIKQFKQSKDMMSKMSNGKTGGMEKMLGKLGGGKGKLGNMGKMGGMGGMGDMLGGLGGGSSSSNGKKKKKKKKIVKRKK
ncbi:MAG: hypothetical protein U5K84_10140 [Alkalibacterium sp.]|nr:hypothetical protein [Alkalibacterium sp.]